MSDTVTIHAKCLGQLAESVSRTPVTITCAPTAAAALDALAAAHGAIAAIRQSIALATDGGYLDPAATLTDGMSVLIVPPLSGG